MDVKIRAVLTDDVRSLYAKLQQDADATLLDQITTVFLPFYDDPARARQEAVGTDAARRGYSKQQTMRVGTWINAAQNAIDLFAGIS